jgi:hypothetical protein
MHPAGIGGHGGELERGIHRDIRGVAGQVQLAQQNRPLELRDVDDAQPRAPSAR